MNNSYILRAADPFYQALVDRITSKLDMQKILVFEGDVPNAVATLYRTNSQDADRPIIVYNPSFIDQVNLFNPWAMYFVFSHEVAHHYNHDLYGEFLRKKYKINQKSHRQELNADYVAGWILSCEGASLQDALSLSHAIPLIESDTHPDAAARRVAAEKGWREADCGNIPRPRSYTPPVQQVSVDFGKVLFRAVTVAVIFAGVAALLRD